MFKRALVSTSDKSGLIEFLKPLVQKGLEVVSTGGTSKYLRENGIPVKEVAEVTGFPEVMDGRVRTLHPKIHMGLLARSFVPEDMELLKKEGVTPFDLVIVNLYPFEQAFQKGLKGHELIEQIDIGGPSLLRGAAKSFERLVVLCDNKDFTWVGQRAQENQPISEKERQKLASKVFFHTSVYDSLVARVLWNSDEFPTEFSVGGKLQQSLRYGENPHQRAGWYRDPAYAGGCSLNQARQLQGKELSYNNILDCEAALQSLLLLGEAAACVIVKHNTPCGAAFGESALDAYRKAHRGDPVSAFGGIVALNRKVTHALAEELSKIFLECVIAPQYEDEALKVLGAKKNLRLLELPWIETFSSQGALEFKTIQGGVLLQDADLKPTLYSDFEKFKVVGHKPSLQIQKDMVFLNNVVRMVKSNAIVVGAHGQTLGLCGGQTNRVDAVKMALSRAQHILDTHPGVFPKDLVLASDAFFPFRDSVDIAALYGVKWIIQPGGSLKDAEVEQAAKEHGITLVLTGLRHFKH